MTGLAQEPDGLPFDETTAGDQHGRLGQRRHFVIERLDRGPEVRHAEDFPRHRIGARDFIRGHTGLLAHLVNEVDADAVDQIVGHYGGDDLPPQAVLADLLGEAFAQGLGEVVAQV